MLFVYTTAAIVLAYWSNQSVAQQVLTNRPAVIANIVSPIDGHPWEVKTTVVNFGKTLALDVVVPGEIITAPEKEPAPFDDRCSEHRNIVPLDIANRVDESKRGVKLL